MYGMLHSEDFATQKLVILTSLRGRIPTSQMCGMLHSEDCVQHDTAKFLYSLNGHSARGYSQNDMCRVAFYPLRKSANIVAEVPRSIPFASNDRVVGILRSEDFATQKLVILTHSTSLRAGLSSRKNPDELDVRDASLRRLRTLRGVPTA